MEVSIRQATPDDRTFIETLGSRTVMDSVSAMRPADPSDVIENFERLLKIVESREHSAFIAQADGDRVGFLLMLHSLPDEVTGNDQAFIAYMAVAREHRATGIGAALLRAAENEARLRGSAYMAMMVTEDNDPARALYDRSGYVTERRLLCKTL